MPPNTLHVGIPGDWGPLEPYLQCTAYADLILLNVYEPLVLLDREGAICPGIAVSWEISAEYKTVTFRLDPQKTFHDGTNVTAQDIKKCWEYGLRQVPASANHSMADALYLLEGWENFLETGRISGVAAVREDTLQLKFKEPFRLGIQNLTGSRYGIFKVIDGQIIGTGAYRILKSAPSEALLQRVNSSAHSLFEYVHLSNQNASNASDLMENQKLDVFAFFTCSPPALPENTSISVINGLEVAHLALDVNGMPGKLFSDAEARRALQYLLLSKRRDDVIRNLSQSNLRFDFQVFLATQPGRIEEAKVAAIIEDGKQHLDHLRSLAAHKPLWVMSARPIQWLIDLLKSEGIAVAETSRTVDYAVQIEQFYKKYEPDLILAAFSVMNGDPDGAYHCFGKTGAISSPMIHREKVCRLLEEGRHLLQENEVAEHYKKVTETILEEVPVVHFAYVQGDVWYRNHKVKYVSNPLKHGLFFDQFKRY